jgi:hypothetical protein
MGRRGAPTIRIRALPVGGGGAKIPLAAVARDPFDKMSEIFEIRRLHHSVTKVIMRNNRPSDSLANALIQENTMVLYFDRPLIFWSFPILFFLNGCSAQPECDSPETRSAVLQTISDDHRNPLIDFAAKNSSPQAHLGGTKPLYLLGEKIVTTSTSKDKRTLQCSGAISVTVGDTKASKEVEFTVQRALDGKISVSVAPFQF